jgi:hypothetical protein
VPTWDNCALASCSSLRKLSLSNPASGERTEVADDGGDNGWEEAEAADNKDVEDEENDEDAGGFGGVGVAAAGLLLDKPCIES